MRGDNKAVATSGDDVDRDGCSEIRNHTQILDLGNPTAAGSGAGYPPPVVAVMVVGQN